ncbi:Hypothetical protein HEAR2245 [Herminiimonas arsenicoxydans]|uniref:Uncharacterized protein n=1 Tax=Herminiimonas arsenicoxydans TaxID=204773 RepID=A4G792_HERAR|nr:Hypothetical protein HEAR2245 [Herminiimonas arsenicoxydans]
MTRLQCLKCNHYQLSRKKCKAFPRGIPSKIYDGDFDHTMAFEGDRGIRYVDLEIPASKEDQREKTLKLVRIDFDAGEGVIEHYSLINSETRETTNYLVLSLPEKLRDKRNGS